MVDAMGWLGLVCKHQQHRRSARVLLWVLFAWTLVTAVGAGSGWRSPDLEDETAVRWVLLRFGATRDGGVSDVSVADSRIICSSDGEEVFSQYVNRLSEEWDFLVRIEMDNRLGEEDRMFTVLLPDPRHSTALCGGGAGVVVDHHNAESVESFLTPSEGFSAFYVPLHATRLLVTEKAQLSSSSSSENAPPIHIRLDLPQAAEKEIRCEKSARGAHTTVARPRFESLADNAQQTLTVVRQVTDPSLTKNIVFLAAGFTAADEGRFHVKVQQAFRFLMGLATDDVGAPPSPFPWDRYLPLMNVYSVYQPSPESGATYPTDAYGNPTSPKKLVKTVNDNLGCRYGKTAATWRFLQCDPARVARLATAAPGKTEKQIVIVLVNAFNDDLGEYGGQAFPSQRPRHVVTYTGKYMVRVILHELGHADASLFDEYLSTPAINSKPKDPTGPNCARAADNANWQYWFQIPYPLGLAGKPTVNQGCFFNDYYRPSLDNCIMKDVQRNHMCPICAERSLAAIYRDVSDLASPSCPQIYETLILLDDGQPRFVAVNEQFGVSRGSHQSLRTDNGPVSVVWTFPDGSQRSGRSIQLTSSMLGPVRKDNQSYVITVNVTDQSQFLRATAPDPTVDPEGAKQYASVRALMTYSRSIRVLVVRANDPEYAHCSVDNLRRIALNQNASSNSAGGNNWPPLVNACPWPSTATMPSLYCAKCDAGKTCFHGLTAAAVSVSVDSNAAAAASAAAAGEGESDWKSPTGALLAVGLCLGIAGILGSVAIWYATTRRAIQQAIPLPLAVKGMRWLLFFMSIVFALAGLTIVLAGIYILTELAAFGQSLIVAGIAFGAFMYLTGFVGLSAACRVRFRWLLVATLMLCVAMALVVSLAAVVFRIGIYIDKYADEIQQDWMDRVESDPAAICRIEKHGSCSGFTNACNNVFHVQCPAGCPLANSDSDPCFVKAQQVVRDNFQLAGAIALAVAFAMFLGIVSCLVLLYFVRDHRTDVRAALSKRRPGNKHMPASIVAIQNLEPDHRKRLLHEFTKIDVNKDGTIDPNELVAFYRSALGLRISKDEAETVIDAYGNADHDNRLNFTEFMKLCEAQLITDPLPPAASENPEGDHSADAKYEGGGQVKRSHPNGTSEAEGTLTTTAAPLTADEWARQATLIHDFSKIDTNGDGLISAADLGMYCNAHFGTAPNLTRKHYLFSHFSSTVENLRFATTLANAEAQATAAAAATKGAANSRSSSPMVGGMGLELRKQQQQQEREKGTMDVSLDGSGRRTPNKAAAHFCPVCAAPSEQGKFCSYSCYINRSQPRAGAGLGSGAGTPPTVRPTVTIDPVPSPDTMPSTIRKNQTQRSPNDNSTTQLPNQLDFDSLHQP